MCFVGFREALCVRSDFGSVCFWTPLGPFSLSTVKVSVWFALLVLSQIHFFYLHVFLNIRSDFILGRAAKANEVDQQS